MKKDACLELQKLFKMYPIRAPKQPLLWSRLAEAFRNKFPIEFPNKARNLVVFLFILP